MAQETILVVDDNPLNLKLTRFLLEDNGYKVVTAADGPEALTVTEKVRPRLVLLDVQLRGIDGIEVARKIKTNPATRSTIVVALTAHATKAAEDEARSAGCDGYITKPIDAVRFPSQVRSYLDASPLPRRRTVLAVDNSADRREALGQLLQGQGYDVVYAQDDSEALVSAVKHEVDAVISDVLVPRLSGFRLCQSVRQETKLRRTPVILVTSGNVRSADERLGRRLGANGLVSRDTNQDVLISALAKAIEDGPVAAPMETDELAAIRTDFIAAAARDSQRLAAEGLTESSVPAAKKLAHAWAGTAGTLGFPQISQAALHLERMLESGFRSDLNQDIARLADMFRRSRENQQQDVPSVWVGGLLQDRRIAVSGFSPEETSRILQQLQASGAVAERVKSASVSGGTCELLIAEASGFTSKVDTGGVPVLLVGATTTLHALHRVNAVHDLLVRPWISDEIVVRSHRLLTGVVPRRTASAVKGKAPEILIADDDPTIAAIVLSILEGHGMECRIADRGGIVIGLAEERRPDAIVLDVNLPDLDGFQVLSRIRSHPTLQDCLVLLLTARQQETDIMKGFGLGADDYVVKPFSPMELVARIRRLLKERDRQCA